MNKRPTFALTHSLSSGFLPVSLSGINVLQNGRGGHPDFQDILRMAVDQAAQPEFRLEGFDLLPVFHIQANGMTA